MELKEFIVMAKKQTYASGESAKKLVDEFEEFIYEKENYKYQDKYYAQDPNPFGGEEIVWQNNKPVWIMNYYGFMLSSEIESKKVYEFLRKAMGLVNEDFPFRGPLNFKEGSFEYVNEILGNMDKFKGREKILFEGKEVYQLEYHGGKL